MYVYNYTRDTKEYISTTVAREDPLDKGKYLIPAYATTVPIMEQKEGYTQVFNEEKNEWEYVEDHRGETVYNTETKEPVIVDYLGPIKDGYTLLKPGEFSKWNGTEWVLDIDAARAAKKAQIKQALQQYLQVLHLSNGVDIVNNLQEQTNNLNSLTLSQMAIKSPKWQANTNYKVNDVVYVNDVLLLCMTAGESGTTAPTPPTDFGVVVTDNTTAWAKLGFLVKTTEGRKYFTPQQIIQMSEEATKIIHDALLKYNNIKEQIKQATTLDELNKITWSN